MYVSFRTKQLILGKSLTRFCEKAGTEMIGCKRHLLSDTDKVCPVDSRLRSECGDANADAFLCVTCLTVMSLSLSILFYYFFYLIFSFSNYP